MTSHGVIPIGLYLAQTPPGWDAARVLWSVAGLTVAVVVLGVVAMLVRRWMLKDDQPGTRPGFTLADMRRMHAAGDLSDEEYERARAALLGEARHGLEDGPALKQETGGRRPPQGEVGGEGEKADGPDEPDADKPDEGRN
ncbi:MAG: SHOCT domain-containing protein [Phycisphaeraceae bacterium]